MHVGRQHVATGQATASVFCHTLLTVLPPIMLLHPCCCHAAAAFVEMDEAGANAALKGLDQKEFMGRTLFISEARPREEGQEGRGFRRDRQERPPYRRQDRQDNDGW